MEMKTLAICCLGLWIVFVLLTTVYKFFIKKRFKDNQQALVGYKIMLVGLFVLSIGLTLDIVF